MWEWDNRVRWLVALVLAALLFGLGARYGSWQSRQLSSSLPRVIENGSDSEEEIANQTAVASTETTIQVHVAGAVESPGVYTLPFGSRVIEAINLAGLLPDAEPNALNLAAILQDEQQIIVPRQGEISSSTGNATPSYNSNASNQAGAKLNINTATLTELETLPGIGPVLAQRILDYRQQKGPFRTIEDLQNVPGIGAKRFSELQEKITVK
ncbi:MAG: ComEA family DNA-binding protein [Clostridia bacterium]|nr:ComEA family DNA-binding protein [Clostridia bacterium]